MRFSPGELDDESGARIGFLLVLLAALSYANNHQRAWQSGALLDVTTESYAFPRNQPPAGQVDTGDVSLSHRHFAVRFNVIELLARQRRFHLGGDSRLTV